MYQFRSLNGFDENNIPISVPFKKLGKNKIYISNEVDAKVVIEYYVYPTVITEETEDDFQLEVDQDAQMIMPYLVANDILKVDPSSDYTAFQSEYERKLQALDASLEGTTVSIIEGVI